MHGIADTASRHRPSVTSDDRAGPRGSLFGAVVAGAVAVPLIGLALIARGTASDVADETTAVQARVDYATATATAPTEVLQALADERAAATAWLTGIADPPEMGTPENAQAREAVDDALATLRSHLSRLEEGTLADTFRFPLDQAAGLVALRATVDEVPEDRRAPDSDVVTTTVDGYTDIMDTFAAAWERESLWLADPDMRQGARLAGLAVQQQALAADVTRTLARGAGGDDAVFEAILAELIVWSDDLREGNAAIEDTADGEYAAPAAALMADWQVTELPRLLDEAVASGEVEIGAVLDAAVLAGDDSAYATFERDVGATFEARADDLIAEAQARERRYVAVAAVAGLAAAGAIGTMLLLLALAARRR
jgi:hypothetical protein